MGFHLDGFDVIDGPPIEHFLTTQFGRIRLVMAATGTVGNEGNQA